MKILKLTAHNVMRLTAVEISPDGNTVIISGKNAQGKSSVLNAIWLALDYSAAHKEVKEPLRNGATEGDISIDLGDFTVTRIFSGNGDSRIKVENTHGARYPSPQAMLDKLLSNLTFNPVAWAMAPDAVQLGDLRNLVGLDFTEMDAERKRIYEERTQVNRLAKEAETILADLPKPEGKSPVPVKIDDLQQKLREADAAHAAFDSLQERQKDIERRIEDRRQVIADLREQARKIEELIRVNETNIENFESDSADLAVEASTIVLPDRQAIIDKIASAGQVNDAIRQREQYLVQRKRFEEHAEKAADLTKELNRIDKEKADKLAAADMPIAGLSFDESRVLYQGVPLSQASQAERILVGLAIGAALNPELRVICVHDASLLDEDSWQTITGWAEEHDFQVWLEVVSNSPSDDSGFFIEDGQVKAINGKEVN